MYVTNILEYAELRTQKRIPEAKLTNLKSALMLSISPYCSKVRGALIMLCGEGDPKGWSTALITALGSLLLMLCNMSSGLAWLGSV
jgi:hypothetical protein